MENEDCMVYGVCNAQSTMVTCGRAENPKYFNIHVTK